MNNFEKLLLQKDEEITRLKNLLERYEKPKKQGKRTYGSGSIRLISKAKGSYKLEYKKMSKTIIVNTPAEAKRQLKEWVTEVDSSKYTRRGKLTLGQYIDYFLNEYMVTRNIAPATKQNYNSVLLNNTKEISPIPLSDIKPDIMTKFFAEKEKIGIGKSQRRQLQTLLINLFKLAVDEDVISKSPIRKTTVKTIYLDKEDRPAWTPDEWKIFINAVDKSHPHLVDLYQLMASCAIGSAEALGLQWQDIDFNKRTYSINRNRTQYGIGKTKNQFRTRELPLSDFAFKILTEVKEQQEAWAIAGVWKDKTVIAGSPECAVFTLRDGTEIQYQHPAKIFVRIRKATKLPVFNLHKVRKLFASWAQEQGATTFETARILGHSTPSTTEKHYTSISDERIREVGNMVGALLNREK